MRHVEFKRLMPPETSVAVSHPLCDALEQAITRVFEKTDTVIHVEPFSENPSSDISTQRN
ncbi:cation transporter dimerization domain-containing protein [Niveibacterium terrae]|uniref:cation transporter dimerization domain-containing protein n=1 Tax=Niveibacterium terrae TaxID=3373598 RepID=UPI003A932EED